MRREDLNETFHPRPIGSNWLACFVCGKIKDGCLDVTQEGQPAGVLVRSRLGQDRISYQGGYYSCQPDMSAFVENRAAGMRIVRAFAKHEARAFLDYRPYEPNHVQVKLGACEEHLPNLKFLKALVEAADDKITLPVIKRALLLSSEEPTDQKE